MSLLYPEPGHIEDSLKRIRVLFDGKYIVDSREAKLVSA